MSRARQGGELTRHNEETLRRASLEGPLAHPAGTDPLETASLLRLEGLGYLQRIFGGSGPDATLGRFEITILGRAVLSVTKDPTPTVADARALLLAFMSESDQSS